MGAESREIYLKGRHSREVRAYHKMLRQLLIELGVHSLDAESDVEEIVELESRLANVSFLDCVFVFTFFCRFGQKDKSFLFPIPQE